jgi:hypothetical protein
MSEENKNMEEKPLAENTTEENNSSEEIVMNNTEQAQTEDMEVHHHTHAGHHKKSWKEYIWEFLMLFLAVFCGFLAEYQLEHVIEHSREKEFIRSYIEDLKTDTAAINANLVFRKKKGAQLDSLLGLLSGQKIKGYESELYYLGRILVRTSRFQINDRTITQLKYSGSLRLIRNESAADSIISYEKLSDYILQNQDDDRIERRAVDPVLAKIYNPFILDKMLGESNNINKPIGNPPLRSYDVNLQQDLAYWINQIKGSNILITTRLKLLNEKAKNIINFLQKEYHLE